MLYVVTAINNLTGEREVISAPRSLNQTKLMMKKHKNKRHRPYTNLRIEEYVTQLKIW